MKLYGFKIIIKGKRACFTRPELKTERVSYDVPTPGALEGLLKSIYWKPAIRYVIDRIVVFNEPRFDSMMRNEIDYKLSIGSVRNKMRDPATDLCIDPNQHRAQRNTYFLTNVCYGVEFHFEMTGLQSEKPDSTPMKYYSIISERLKAGSYYKRPCLGCRDFPADSVTLVDAFDMSMMEESLRNKEDVDLGVMAYRVHFLDNGIPKDNDWKKKRFSDKAVTKYYRPHMKSGVIDVAEYPIYGGS